MTWSGNTRGGRERLLGRRAECVVLGDLLDAVRAGESRVLVVRGEAGVGKTALLEQLAGRARDCLVVGAAGIESESELAFAGLHQLFATLPDRAHALPEPQRNAVHVAFGLRSGPPPDLFLLGLAILGLLSEASSKQPLICLVDDVQWLDRASVRTLAFVARRLRTESVGLVFATRAVGEELAGLPELRVEGLPEPDARTLLDSVLTAGPIDACVRDQIVAETRGNPLAIVELPRGMTAAELAGGYGLPGALAPSWDLDVSFRRRIAALPAGTRCLVRLAAAEPSGDATLLWRAARELGVGADAAEPAVEAGLIELGPRVRFRHPLVRSAAYRSATARERRDAHRALAAATDPELDPDRRAWHRAHSAEGPDEEVAAELELSAHRAKARGGRSAAAAFCERAATLTPDPAKRVGRALTAARALHQAGALDAALAMLALADAGPHDELSLARASLLRGQFAFGTGRSAEGPGLLLEAARRFEPLDVRRSRETYLDALFSAMYAGRLATPVGLTQVAKSALGAPPGDPNRPTDLLLDGLATLIVEGHGAGTAPVRRAVRAFRDHGRPEDEQELSRLFVAVRAAHEIWDDEGWQHLANRNIRWARDTGELSALPLALSQRLFVHLHAGELAEAAALVDELAAIREATGDRLPAYGAMTLAGWRGRDEATRLVEIVVADATARGESIGVILAHYTGSVLGNAQGRYEQALASAELATAYPEELGNSIWGLVELVEAAVRCGKPDRAAYALERLTASTQPAGTPWGLGVEARSRALTLTLTGDDEAAEHHFRASITHLESSLGRSELARAHLVYGEWLRRQRRRADARTQLRTAHGMFDAMGMDAFAARARRELRATGESARKRTADTALALTPQEAQIARLAGEGLSNPEIAARLYLSPRTVQYHLGKVFTKLGITARGELRGIVPVPDGTAIPSP